MSYKISVIIPVYNVEFYLERCLLSLKNQTIGFENLEIIFIDDCSTDRSAFLIHKFIDKFENVKGIFLESNSGSAGKPRNFGIDVASADYLMFLDPDDFYTNDACEILYETITNENADMVSGVHSIKNEEGNYEIFPGLWLSTLSDPNDSWKIRNNLKNKILKENVGERGFAEIKLNSLDDKESILGNFCLLSKIFKKSFINKFNIRFPNGVLAEDSLFLLKVFYFAKGLIFLDKNVYCYDFRNDEGNESVSFQSDVKRNCERIESYNLMLSLSKEVNKKDAFLHYLLGPKLIYFLKNFVLYSKFTKDEYYLMFDKSIELFKEVFNSDFSLDDSYYPIFKNISNKNYDVAINNIAMFKSEFDKKDSSNINSKKLIRDIKVAVIMDPFTYNSFKDEFVPIILTPNNWKEKFNNEKPDLFICESAFQGVKEDLIVDGVAIESGDGSGPWVGKLGFNKFSGRDNRNDLREIINYCKNNGITTIFWNKEDPTSFNNPKYNFIGTALMFDYIFTTAEECIPNYIGKGAKNVSSLQFASNIHLFNPIESYEIYNEDETLQSKRIEDIVFAGSWYRQFEERSLIMQELFSKILNSDYNLKIYDRMFGTKAINRIFPEEYKKYTNPSVPFNKMPEVYKESNYSLNINTVTKSYSMFARRVFELMSSNTVVLSNFSKGVYDLFKDNVIYLDKLDKLEITNIDKLKEDNLYNILENHTYFNRFKYILDIINFEYCDEIKEINVFYKLNSFDDICLITEDFNNIRYYYKNLIFVLDKFELEDELNQIINHLNLNNLIYVFKDELPKFKKNISLLNDTYFVFTDLETDKDFLYKSILHYSYIDNNCGIRSKKDNQYFFNRVDCVTNVLFNIDNYDKVVCCLLGEKQSFIIYNI